MHRVLVFLAFVALCAAAPYGDADAQRSFGVQQERQLVQKPVNVARVEQRDESEIVDTLGGGYSFFKKQPIGSRPLIQQKLAIHEQQVPISSFDDTPNQWSEYTKASAFKQLPAKTQHAPLSNDLTRSGYGQQQQTLSSDLILTAPTHTRTSVSSGYGNQQEDLKARVQLAPKITVSRDQGGYGSAGAQLGQQIENIDEDNFGQQEDKIVIQQQPLSRNAGNSYGQQQEVRTLVQQQPLIRNTGSSYGQQEERLVQQQQPLIRNAGNSYGQQQEVRTLVQQQPLIRNAGSSYGQQEDKIVIQQQQPLIRNAESSYGQQQDIRTLVQQQPLIRNAGSSYGQQEERLVQHQQPLIRNFDNSYGQQEVRNLLPQQPLVRNTGNGYGQQEERLVQQQPLIRNTENSYGQQQDIRTLVQQQPLIRNFDNSYGQQQEVRTLVPQQPLIRTTGNSYGQQQEVRTLVPQQPLIRNTGNSYGQQQEVRSLVQQQPLIRDAGSSYGQEERSISMPKSINGLGQRANIILNDDITDGEWSQQSQPKMSAQPSFSSHHTELPRNNGFATSQRSGSQTQLSDSGSFAGW